MLATRRPGDRAYLTEIGGANKMGETARNVLNLGGPRNFPPEMSVGALQPVYDPTQGGFGYSEYLNMQTPANSIAAVAQSDLTIVAPNVTFPNAAGSIDAYSNQRKRLSEDGRALIGASIPWESRLHALEAEIEFDAAGAAAFAGKLISVYLFLTAVTGNLGQLTTTRVANWRSVIIVGAPTLYRWNANGGSQAPAVSPQGIPGTLWTRWIPSGYSLILRIQSEDGTVFPANTTALVSGSMNQVPRGAFLPL